MSDEYRPLFIDVLERGALVLCRLDGAIHEDASLHTRLPGVEGRKILIHLARVEHLNALGVRDFVTWVRDLEARGNTLYFVHCPPPVIAQVNQVRNFAGARGHVLSFLAPYFCETCEREQLETFLTQDVRTLTSPPAGLCHACGGGLSFEGPPGFFNFLKQHGPKTAEPEVLRAMNTFDDALVATKAAELKDISSSRGVTPGG